MGVDFRQTRPEDEDVGAILTKALVRLGHLVEQAFATPVVLYSAMGVDFRQTRPKNFRTMLRRAKVRESKERVKILAKNAQVSLLRRSVVLETQQSISKLWWIILPQGLREIPMI